MIVKYMELGISMKLMGLIFLLSSSIFHEIRICGIKFFRIHELFLLLTCVSIDKYVGEF